MHSIKKIIFVLIIGAIGALVSCNENEPVTQDVLAGQWSACDQVLVDEALAPCLPPKSDAQIEIWTWNLEFFPQEELTQQSVIKILEYYRPDIIAFQEINKRDRMQEVLEAMPLYDGWVVNVSGSLDLGFAYNTCTVTSLSEPGTQPATDVWPRPVVHWKAQVNGQEVNLLNIHLKCCDNGVEARTTAVETIRNYILESLPEKNVILLGDYNDEIEDISLLALSEDTTNFRFADLHIARGDEAYWSYPGWPSHIDHILVNEQLFDELDTAYTLLLEQCVGGYSFRVSDHRPVSALLSF